MLAVRFESRIKTRTARLGRRRRHIDCVSTGHRHADRSIHYFTTVYFVLLLPASSTVHSTILPKQHFPGKDGASLTNGSGGQQDVVGLDEFLNKSPQQPRMSSGGSTSPPASPARNPSQEGIYYVEDRNRKLLRITHKNPMDFFQVGRPAGSFSADNPRENFQRQSPGVEVRT